MLILDESVAALDVSIQAQILNLLADIRDETGISYILISHDLAVVRQITDEAIVMHRGRVVERGPTAACSTTPATPYTQLLRASVPRPGWKPTRAVRVPTQGSSDSSTSPLVNGRVRTLDPDRPAATAIGVAGDTDRRGRRRRRGPRGRLRDDGGDRPRRRGGHARASSTATSIRSWAPSSRAAPT